jgi:hypothetical protein
MTQYNAIESYFLPFYDELNKIYNPCQTYDFYINKLCFSDLDFDEETGIYKKSDLYKNSDAYIEPKRSLYNNKIEEFKKIRSKCDNYNIQTFDNVKYLFEFVFVVLYFDNKMDLFDICIHNVLDNYKDWLIGEDEDTINLKKNLKKINKKFEI